MEKKPFVTLAQVEEIAKTYPTPFYLYDEKGIRENVARNADHPQDVHRGIVAEFAQSSLFVQFLLPLKVFI